MTAPEIEMPDLGRDVWARRPRPTPRPKRTAEPEIEMRGLKLLRHRRPDALAVAIIAAGLALMAAALVVLAAGGARRGPDESEAGVEETAIVVEVARR
ncbi:MAG: hypothetical protein PVI23_04180 [Maricaulaceae bacterium]|jgi:hypothetical protein